MNTIKNFAKKLNLFAKYQYYRAKLSNRFNDSLEYCLHFKKN